MANVPHFAFNRGIISTLALARADVKRVGMSAVIQSNWMPRVMGAMSLRTGWEYKDTTNGNARAIHIPFVFSSADTAIIELTDSAMRVRVNEAIISRAAVATALANGNFTGYVTNPNFTVTTGWTLGSGWAITGVPPVAATGSYTFASNPGAGGGPGGGSSDSIILNGVTWTFVATGAHGNQTNIGGSLSATLTQLVTDLNASGNAAIAKATYAKSGTTKLTIAYDTPGAAGNSYTIAQGTNHSYGGFASGATLTGGADSSGTAAVATTATSALSQTSGVALVNGTSYQITYTITRSAGTVTPSIGGTAGTARSAAGTYTETIVAGATQLIAFTGAAFSGSVNNIQVAGTTVGWVDNDEAGTASSIIAGQLSFVGTSFAAARRTQLLTIAGGDVGTEHALRIVVAKGSVVLKVGSASGLDDYLAGGTASLGVGTHSIAFTPTTTSAYVDLSSADIPGAIVTQCTLEAAGVMSVPAPWAESDLDLIRWDSSADVTYVAAKGYAQYKIERRSTTSWSVVSYMPADGPFRLQNISTTTITPSAISGDITLTASRSIFRSTHVGALFRLTSTGQTVTASIGAQNLFSNAITVTGVGASRKFNLNITGTFVATVTLQSSLDTGVTWTDVAGESWTAPVATTYSDGLDNEIVQYRLGVKTGGYTSGTVNVEEDFAGGGITGIVRITAFTSGTVVTAAVLSPLGGTSGTNQWSEGSWSYLRGYPSAVAFMEGRLYWAGKGAINGSVADGYESFDDTVIGDAGPISRTIGSGPVDNIAWLMALQRLLIGTDLREFSARSSALDDPLTPTAFNIKSPSNQGSAAVGGMVIDGRGLFVALCGTKLYQLTYQGAYNAVDYAAEHLTEICPDILAAGVKRMSFQRQPDTRVHVVLNDGSVAVLVSQPAEDVLCWVKIVTDGIIEDVFRMPNPGAVDDAIYYVVNRTVNGATVRYLEKWAQESECIGGTLNKQADSFVTYSGVATGTITAAHLKAKTCVIWGDGKALGSAVADAGTGVVTIPNGITASNIMVGLSYTAQFQSAKLLEIAQAGTALAQVRKIDTLGLILQNTHPKGIYFGQDFVTLDTLPEIEDGAAVDQNAVWANYDKVATNFPGSFDTDGRLCLQAMAPYPCTVLAAVMGITQYEKVG